MPTDPWPDEPEEVDPEDRWGDPERDLVKNIAIEAEPEEDADEEPELSSEAVSGEVSRLFWASVVLVNVAVFALSLGPMLIVFRDQWILGLGLVGGGTFALSRTYRLYQQFKRERAEQANADLEDENEGDSADEVGDADDAGDVDDTMNDDGDGRQDGTDDSHRT